MCAHFVDAGLTPNDRPEGASITALSDATAALILAAKGGETSPVRKPVTALSDKIAEAWVTQAIDLGVTEKQLNAVATGNLQLLSDVDQCDVGLKLLESVNNLPQNDADHITSFLLTIQSK